MDPRPGLAGPPGPNLRPVVGAFLVFGAFWGSWAVAAVDIERFLGVGHAVFGLLLSAAVVAAALANAVGGAGAERWGTRLALSRSLAAWSLLVFGLSELDHPVAFAVVFVASLAAGGAIDVVMNVAATAALGEHPGRLLRFHALFNAGAVIGAAVTGLLGRIGVSWRWTWLGIAATAAVLGVLIHRSELPAGERGARHSVGQSLATLRRSRLVGLAVVFAGAALVEGGIGTWGVLALRSRLAAGILVGAGAYVVGQALATAARAGLGTVAAPGRSSLELGGRGAGAGAALAAAGLALEAWSGSPLLAGAGLAAAAVGVSVCWPLLLALAGGQLERPGLVVGGVTTAGYLGMLAGPPLVGWAAGALGLRAGLLVLAAVSLAVALGAVRVRAPDSPAREGSGAFSLGANPGAG